MVEPLVLLALDLCLKLQVLAREVADRGMFLWQGKPIHESVSGKLVFRDQCHDDGLVEFLKDPAVLHYACCVLPLVDQRVHWRGYIGLATTREKLTEHLSISGLN